MSMFGECLKNIIISNRKGNELSSHILVVSASDNVTSHLLEHKKMGGPGVSVKFLHGGWYELAINAGFADVALTAHEADPFVTQVKALRSSMRSRLAFGCRDRSEICLHRSGSRIPPRIASRSWTTTASMRGRSTRAASTIMRR
jgi:hypothetical protein